MKKLILLKALLITVSFSYAQFGGGIGTAIDPYRIYSKAHLEELNDSLLSGNDLTDIHFNLMNDILDSLKIHIGKLDYPFNEHFHCKGHKIALATIKKQRYCNKLIIFSL